MTVESSIIQLWDHNTTSIIVTTMGVNKITRLLNKKKIFSSNTMYMPDVSLVVITSLSTIAVGVSFLIHA